MIAKDVSGNAAAADTAAKLLQSCPTLCDPIDGSPPGSPVPGILQARTLEWVAIAFSSGNARRQLIRNAKLEFMRKISAEDRFQYHLHQYDTNI